MSIVYCDFCDRNIDTDYDAEHFVDEDMERCIEQPCAHNWISLQATGRLHCSKCNETKE